MSGLTKQSEDKYIFTGGEREQYTRGRLELEDVDPASPLPTFRRWFDEAKREGVTADAVCLSTAELPSGRVSSRMVLLKELDKRGFVVYSNFGTSRKSRDLATNPRASLCFWYEDMERSVRVEGTTERLTPAESQVYFDTRPVGSKIGAWASQQSKVLKDRAELDEQVATTKEKFGIARDRDLDDPVTAAGAPEEQKPIPVPDFWGGLRIVPDRIEFWSGRNNRLHDRLVYSLQDDATTWEIKRLSP